MSETGASQSNAALIHRTITRDVAETHLEKYQERQQNIKLILQSIPFGKYTLVSPSAQVVYIEKLVNPIFLSS